VIARAARADLTVASLGFLTYAPEAVPTRQAIVVGYATPPDHLFPGAVEALCGALAP
jgi:GntR family transcriptional regulator / MocR family aminotransferase